jgi:hypothetical protein
MINYLWKIVIFLVISILLLSGGHFFVFQRSLNVHSEYLTIGGDTLSYIKMVDGKWTEVAVPFRHRILVPFIAGLLPFSSMESLKWISYGSLFLTYLMVFLIGRNPL